MYKPGKYFTKSILGKAHLQAKLSPYAKKKRQSIIF